MKQTDEPAVHGDEGVFLILREGRCRPAPMTEVIPAARTRRDGSVAGSKAGKPHFCRVGGNRDIFNTIKQTVQTPKHRNSRMNAARTRMMPVRTDLRSACFFDANRQQRVLVYPPQGAARQRGP